MLGLAVGGRPDDYELSNVDFHARGRAFDQQLRDLHRFWSEDAVGPAPANGRRPALLTRSPIGG